MESTLHDLGGLLLKAVPTIVLLLIVYAYLRWMFFGPLETVLTARKQATEGTREKAEALLTKADQTAAAIQNKLREAREEIYQEREEARRQWTSMQAAEIERARAQLETEAAAAKRDLAATADSLAEEIARTLLERTSA
jgi:F-type H+-transporting ATPase subunit b